LLFVLFYLKNIYILYMYVNYKFIKLGDYNKRRGNASSKKNRKNKKVQLAPKKANLII